MTDDELTAYHEAGHVWAYHRHRMPIRYVTISARNGSVGNTAVWRRRIDPVVASWIAVSGPITQAIRDEEIDPDVLDFDDRLNGAVLAGGHADLQVGGPWWEPQGVRLILGEIERDWAAITALATALRDRGRLTGADAFSTLAAALAESHR